MANDFVLVPGTLSDYCFTSWQQLNIDLFSIAQVIAVNGSRYYNLGPDEPPVDKRDFPWFRTTDLYWYAWSTIAGAWVRPYRVPPGPSSERMIWVGTLSDLKTYDGGVDEPVGVDGASGPFWEEDVNMRARFPLGAGTLPSAAVIVNGTTGGEEKHVLTLAELPDKCLPQQHTPTPEPADGPFLHHDQVEESDIGCNRDTDDNLGEGEAHQNMPPYYGVYFAKRTERQFALPL